MHITIRDTSVPVELSVDQLTLGDAESLEKICGAALSDIDFKRAGAVVALIYIAARKAFPDLKIAEVRDLPISVINAAMTETQPATAPNDDAAAGVAPDPLQTAESAAGPPTA